MKPYPTTRAARASRFMLALTLIASAAPSHAQIRLPGVGGLPLPQRIGPLDTDALGRPASRLLATARLPPLATVRLDEVARLLRQHGDVLATDPRGEPVVRGEILAWSPGAAGLAAAAGLGLEVLRRRALEGLDETMVVFRVPGNADSATVLAKLRALDPAGSYDFNHVYTGSSAAPLEADAPGVTAANAPRPGAPRVGLVDSGVDGGHAVFRDAAITRWGCEGAPHPAAHGTAVAALMVGRSARFKGVAPDANLYAADIYCDRPTGGSAEQIAGALAWMAKEQVPVINISLVGPPNSTMERVVAALQKRGHLLVAAVGNDGPAAPPLYPASYPGVVGVSAVDRDGRVLPEAARGPQVMFAAPGSQMVSAAMGEPPYRVVRGTSFAAPLVAAMLAPALDKPDAGAARLAVAALAAQARRAARNEVSNETGNGIVGTAFRNDPSGFR
jgi:hypothetical protein